MVPKTGTKIEPRGPGFLGPRGPELVPEFGTKMVPKKGTKIEPREPIFRALAVNFSCPAGKKNSPQKLEPKWFQKLESK